MMRSFWRSVALFAYRRWAVPDQRKPVGIPGQRDPDHPCHAYAPRRRGGWEWGDCETDGHYLCVQCAHRVPTEGA
jgi:hypothetical protein